MSRSRKTRKYNTSNVTNALFKGLLLLTVFVVVGLFLYVRLLDSRVERFEDEPVRFLIVQKGDDNILNQLVSVHYLPDKEEVVMVELPPELKIPVVGGYGNYRVENLLQLGELENVDEKILITSIESLFGVPFDWVIYESEVVDEISFNWLSEQLHIYAQSLLDDHQRYYEAQSIWREIRRLSEVKVRILHFEDLKLLLQEDQVDGSEVPVVDELRLDAFISDAITPQLTNFSDVGIVVQNATNHPGLAGYWSRFAVHSGLHLLSLGNAEEQREISQLIFASENIKDGEAGIILQRLYSEAEVSIGDIGRHRSDAVLVLGEDYWREISTKAAFD